MESDKSVATSAVTSESPCLEAATVAEETIEKVGEQLSEKNDEKNPTSADTEDTANVQAESSMPKTDEVHQQLVTCSADIIASAMEKSAENRCIMDEPTSMPDDSKNTSLPAESNATTEEYLDKAPGTKAACSEAEKANDEATVAIEDAQEVPNTENNNEVITSPTEMESEIIASLERSDNKTLNENISHITTELLESMETENKASGSAKPTKNTTKLDCDKPTGSSLSLLAQYNSDSERGSNAGDADVEDEDVMEVPLEANKDYRNKVVEIKSETESESSSSDDSDVEYLTTIRKEIQKTVDFEDDDEDDDEDGAGDEAAGRKKKKQTTMRVKGELLLEDLPPIQDLHITVPEEECVELGRVHSIIDQLLLVSVLPDSLLLDLDTVLFLDKGKKVLGEVFDVLGQVADPMYCVRFNSRKEIEEKGINIGDTVYVAPKTQYTQFVILSSLMKLRGSDASWENDVEPPPRYLDYSDDEQEREARARLRNKDRPNDHEDPAKRSRNNNDEDIASSSSSQSTYAQLGARVKQERTYQNRPRYQRNPALMHTHSGSWHSNYVNYRQPYAPHYMMPQPMPNAMPSAFPPPYPGGPFSPAMPPTAISPMSSPVPPPMYVLNPLAVASPRMQQQQRPPQQRQSPPPAPPGLD